MKIRERLTSLLKSRWMYPVDGFTREGPARTFTARTDERHVPCCRPEGERA